MRLIVLYIVLILAAGLFAGYCLPGALVGAIYGACATGLVVLSKKYKVHSDNDAGLIYGLYVKAIRMFLLTLTVGAFLSLHLWQHLVVDWGKILGEIPRKLIH